MPTDTHIRCLGCGLTWLRASQPDTLNNYLQHPCQQNTRNIHPSEMEPR